MRLVTMHGTVLVFFVLTAGLSGTFANFLIPLQIGARDMASPFMNMLVLLVLLPRQCGDVVFLICTYRSCFRRMDHLSSTECLAPGVDGLKNRYGPLADCDGNVHCFFIAGWSELYFYDPEHAYQRDEHDPYAVDHLGNVLYCVLGVLSFPVLLSGAILLLFDRNLGTSFYLSDIVINGEISAKRRR